MTEHENEDLAEANDMNIFGLKKPKGVKCGIFSVCEWAGSEQEEGRWHRCGKNQGAEIKMNEADYKGESHPDEQQIAPDCPEEIFTEKFPGLKDLTTECRGMTVVNIKFIQEHCLDTANIKKLGKGSFIIKIPKKIFHPDLIEIRNNLAKFRTDNQKFFLIQEDFEIEEVISKQKVLEAIDEVCLNDADDYVQDAGIRIKKKLGLEKK